MDSYDYNTLECRLKAAQAQLRAFRSGAKYQELQALRAHDAAHYNRVIQGLKADVAEAHLETIRVRDLWFEIFEDYKKECDEAVDKKDKELRAMEERALRAERARDDALDRLTEANRRYYEAATERDEEKEKNNKLHAQLNRDFENSSTPSSKSRTPKKIPNSREKTGRKPGGQPGHKGHPRKKQEPTSSRMLPPPQDVIEDPGFRKTGRVKKKQMVSIALTMTVDELVADIYYNPKTNEYRCAEFPSGYVNEVNYDASIRSFLYILNNDCDTSIDKARKFLSDLTGGRLNISKGMINSLLKEFAVKSKPELDEVYTDLLVVPVLHTDNTNAKVDGKQKFVHVCTAPDGRALFYFRDHKGHKGVKGTLVEDYQGILVHDHDTTYYSYGSGHQECSAHILRYLKDSMDNETSLTWNKDMRSLVQEMIHYMNSIPESGLPDEVKVADFEKRYDEILATAKSEYEYEPPGRYYMDGYNLYRRMEKYRDNHLLFLHDIRVPATNNEAERLLRSYKRKQAQAVTFRCSESVDALCKGMSMLVLMRRKKNCNIFEEVADIFRRPKPEPEKKTDSSDS